VASLFRIAGELSPRNIPKVMAQIRLPFPFAISASSRVGLLHVSMESPVMKPKAPEIVLRHGKPSAVILDINAYEDLLEQLEQKADLKALAAARRTKLKFRSFDAFLTERRAHV
jgi:hypothetical protein